MPKITRTIKFHEPLSKEHYTIDATIVWCIDRRFKRGITELKKALDIEKVDRITVAGGAKDFADPENVGDRKYLSKQIEKSIKLHHPKKIILMAHDNCGAYGNTPKNVVLSDLIKAKKIVEEFPPVVKLKIPVETVFVDFESINFIEED